MHNLHLKQAAIEVKTAIITRNVSMVEYRIEKLYEQYKSFFNLIMGNTMLTLAVDDPKSYKWFRKTIEQDIDLKADLISKKNAIRQELDKLFKWYIDGARSLIQLEEEEKTQMNEEKNYVVALTEHPIKATQELLNQPHNKAAQTEVLLKVMHDILNAIDQHPGCRSVIEYSMRETNNNSSIGYSVSEYLNSEGIPTSNSELNAISKRASHFYLLGKERVPIKIKCTNMYFGNEIIYVKQAVQSALGL